MTSSHDNPTDIQQITNLGAAGIPLDFKLEHQFGPIQIGVPPQAYYYSAIKAMKELALEDYNGVIRGETWRTDRFPRLIIEMNTHHATIPRKYVIWGLFLACATMETVTGFGLNFFSMQWQGREVGGLAFSPIHSPSPLFGYLANSTSNQASSQDVVVTDRPSTVVTSSNQTDSLQADAVSVVIAHHGGPLSMFDVMNNIEIAILTAARETLNDRITHVWTAEEDALHTTFSTNQAQSPARSVPPFYTFKVLIESLALAAEQLVAANQYYELAMVVKVDGVAVGSSFLIHKRFMADVSKV